MSQPEPPTKRMTSLVIESDDEEEPVFKRAPVEEIHAKRRIVNSDGLALMADDEDMQLKSNLDGVLEDGVHDSIKSGYPSVVILDRWGEDGIVRNPKYIWGGDVEPAYKTLRPILVTIRDEQTDATSALKDDAVRRHRLWTAEHGTKRMSRPRKEVPYTDESLEPLNQWWIAANKLPVGQDFKPLEWTYFSSNGYIFTPPYKSQSLPVLIKGDAVTIPLVAEEIITFWCAAMNSTYGHKKAFQQNFFSAFMDKIPEDHPMKNGSLGNVTFEDLDVTEAARMLDEQKAAEKEAKKALPAEAKEADLKARQRIENAICFSIVNGLREKLEPFKTEPPTLFRGRGEHPKMGQLKTRTFPELITLNCSRDAPVPSVDMVEVPGHSWGDVVHNYNVTWLSYYKDTVMVQAKYMYLAANSSTKALSDWKKYQKARQLQHYIGKIRSAYDRWMSSTDSKDRQMGLVTYLIDRLALRAGHEKKDEEEAETYGCCSLKAEHVTVNDDATITLEFLGKDSILYHQTVPVDPLPWRVFSSLLKNKPPGDPVFPDVSPTVFNRRLQDECQIKVSAKVFRTFNASFTLQQQLKLTDDLDPQNPDSIKAFYEKCNRDVAILCNHQRAVPKTFDNTVAKAQRKIEDVRDDMTEIDSAITFLESGVEGEFEFHGPVRQREQDEEPRKLMINPTSRLRLDTLQSRLQKKGAQLEKLQTELGIRVDNKSVSTGTSRMHYCDPRITVAFCKRYNYDITRVFQGTLMRKFNWAMSVDCDFVW